MRSLVLLAALTSVADAATVSVSDVIVTEGAEFAFVPLVLEPAFSGEPIGAINLQVAFGSEADAIPIVSATAGPIWAGDFFSIFGAFGGSQLSVETPAHHASVGAIVMFEPTHVTAEGVLATYVLDVSQVPAGEYVVDPNYFRNGVGTTADTPLQFQAGTLTVAPAIYEPETVVLLMVAGVCGWWMQRRKSTFFQASNQ